MTNYSFLKELEEKNDQYQKVSSRFWNRDLHEDMFKRSAPPIEFLAGQPIQHKKELIEKFMKLVNATGQLTIKFYGADQIGAYIITPGDVADICITSTTRHGHYTFWAGRYEELGRKTRDVYMLPYRAMLGYILLHELTGTKPPADFAKLQERSKIWEALSDLQKQYKKDKWQTKRLSTMRQGSGTNAKVWQDKKVVDDEHKELATTYENDSLFTHVEVDNDVEAQEWKDFIAQVDSFFKDHAPVTLKDNAPELRVRKLGRHKARGIYFPHTMSVCVDVRYSASFIHELTHHLDISVKGLLSSSPEYQDIINHYMKNFDSDKGGRKTEYYCSGVEVIARMAEFYWGKVLKDSRLVKCYKNPEELDFPYQPFASYDWEKIEALTMKLWD